MAEEPTLFGDAAAATPKRRRARQKALDAAAKESQRTLDSFQNYGLNLGMGTDNALAASTYGFNPITRIRTLLEWIYRGSWMGAVAVDIIADDMTRAGVSIEGDMKPDDIEDVQSLIGSTGVWNSLNDAEKWARLYGGSIAVILIDGQAMDTPLREDTVRPGQFRGLAVYDRWSVTPSSNLVTELGKNLGLPESYVISEDAPGLRGQRIHYSRVIRLVGIELPWNQRVAENMWGLSVIERLYDRMIAFDSATQGAAQLIYRSANRTYKIKGMRELVASGADYVQVLARYTDMMRKFAGIEGVTLIDANDDLVTTQLNVQGGIAQALDKFGEQISGCLQIPLTRLFGQAPGGLNADGASNLITYYDGVNNQQNKELKEGVSLIYRLAARSAGKKVTPKFQIKFNPLWQIDDKTKSEIAERDARSIADLADAGLLDKPTAMRELRQSGGVHGRFTNITDEMITEAENEPDLPLPGIEGALDKPEPQLLLEDKTDKAERRAKTRDDLPLRQFQNLQLMIETEKGQTRRGNGWSVDMPADYGFIRGTSSAEGIYEQMDCFVGPNVSAPMAFIIDGATPEGSFDEHKVMLGFHDLHEALACYRAAYHDMRRPMGVTPMDLNSLATWLASGDVTKPLSGRPTLVAVR